MRGVATVHKAVESLMHLPPLMQLSCVDPHLHPAV